jgi:hypothetical protein
MSPNSVSKVSFVPTIINLAILEYLKLVCLC